MPALALALRHTYIRCPDGRLVVRPTHGDGHEALQLDGDGLALMRDETQIGVRAAGDVLVEFRLELRPSVFEHSIAISRRSGLWVGDIEGASGVDLAAPPGNYVITGWFAQGDAPVVGHIILGIRATA